MSYGQPSTPSSGSELVVSSSLMSSDLTEPGAFAVSLKTARASIFVKWIVETFKQEWLRDGGIIDVAGGRVSSTLITSLL